MSDISQLSASWKKANACVKAVNSHDAQLISSTISLPPRQPSKQASICYHHISSTWLRPSLSKGRLQASFGLSYRLGSITALSARRGSSLLVTNFNPTLVTPPSGGTLTTESELYKKVWPSMMSTKSEPSSNPTIHHTNAANAHNVLPISVLSSSMAHPQHSYALPSTPPCLTSTRCKTSQIPTSKELNAGVPTKKQWSDI